MLAEEGAHQNVPKPQTQTLFVAHSNPKKSHFHLKSWHTSCPIFIIISLHFPSFLPFSSIFFHFFHFLPFPFIFCRVLSCSFLFFHLLFNFLSSFFFFLFFFSLFFFFSGFECEVVEKIHCEPTHHTQETTHQFDRQFLRVVTSKCSTPL